MAVYIELAHGRTTPDEELHDWGTAGPVLGPFLFVHCVYASEVNVQTVKGAEMNWPLPEGLFLYDGVYYGDWTVIDDASLSGSNVLMARLVSLDEPGNGVEKPEEAANPERIQRSRKKGSKLPEGCICVTRPGPYGNPYPIGSRHIFRDADSGQEFEGTVVDVKGSLAFFRKYAMERLRENPNWLKPLRGKTLACWCPVNTPCHGDILLELANAPEP